MARRRARRERRTEMPRKVDEGRSAISIGSSGIALHWVVLRRRRSEAFNAELVCLLASSFGTMYYIY